MSEEKFAGEVIVKSIQRRTKTVLGSVTPMSWTGRDFKKSEESRLSKIKGLKIERTKGTFKIDLTKIRKTTVPNLEGRYISSKKGIELLKL
ncbi:hypothetical protein [Nitrosopumilus sp.]|uniref:hypothetical protein n=1 Tax=Nitrosopumilus sp. TaxID=2024843 RepID=UPI00292E7766|nr:hypothetical protein [Nitrosopumilus sp.]